MSQFGRIADVILVENQNARFGAADEYFAIRVQFADQTESTLFFTWNEIEVALDRAQKNNEDVPKADSLTDKTRDLLD